MIHMMTRVAAIAGAVALGFAAWSIPVESVRAESLSHFAGNWTGAGTITLQSGTKERIRCRGNYTVSADGNALRLALKCASDSYNFELQSEIVSDGRNVSGTWIEATRQVNGSMTGRMVGNRIDATANSPNFNATLALTTRGNSQSVLIRSPGSEMSEVAISLTRGGR